MIAHDSLLAWASERGSGSWAAMRNAIASLQHGVGRDAQPAWMFANSLQLLGHIDIDFVRGKWSASPPALCLLPGTSLCAVLVGSRTHHFTEAFRASAFDTPGTFDFDIGNDNGPVSLFIKADDVGTLEAVAKRLEIPLVVDPAAQLAAITPRLDAALTVATRPHPAAELECFSTDDLRWRSTGAATTPGLYRWKHQNQTFPRLLDAEGEWWSSDDLGHLHFTALRLDGRDVLVWRRGNSDGSTPRRLIVPKGVTLPTLTARAVVASCGLLPMLTDHHRIYRNVSLDIARHLADTLHQYLDEE